MSKVKSFFLEIYYFLTSKVFLKNFALMLGSFFGLLLLIFYFLDWYTLHDQSISVPDLRGQTVEQVKDLLKVSGLKYEVIDSTYDAKKLPHVILEQRPKPNAKVKESRVIYLTVSKASPPKVQLTYGQIVGKGYENVAQLLKNKGLVVGKIEYAEGRGRNTLKAASIDGRILFEEISNYSGGQDPRQQTVDLYKGDVIDLILYKGIDAGPKVIPDVQCWEYGEAEILIKSNGFLVGTVSYLGPITDTLGAHVVSQRPMAGSRHTMGTAISITLVADPPEGCADKLINDTDSPTNNGSDVTDPDPFGLDD